MPTAQEVLQAHYLDQNNAGGWTGGGGAADHARAMNWAKFQQSNLGRLLANDPAAQRRAFEQRYNGGGVAMKYGTNDAEGAKRLAQLATATQNAQAAAPSAQTGQTPQPVPVGQRGQLAAAMNSPQALAALLFANAERERRAANQANIDRFDRGDMMYQDRHNRVMDEVANWGKAGEQDLEEQSRNSLNTILAHNAARGLGNSSVDGAFMQKNATDLAREKLRHSENVSNRKANFDQSLSKDHIDFIERRNDIGPDMGQIAQLAQMLGNANSTVHGGQSGEVSPAGQRAAVPRVGTMTPWEAIQRASAFPGSRTPQQDNIFPGNPLNPMSVLGAVNAGVSSLVPQGMPTASDRYPQTRSPGYYEWIKQQSAARTAAARAKNQAFNIRDMERRIRETPHLFGP